MRARKKDIMIQDKEVGIISVRQSWDWRGGGRKRGSGRKINMFKLTYNLLSVALHQVLFSVLPLPTTLGEMTPTL